MLVNFIQEYEMYEEKITYGVFQKLHRCKKKKKKKTIDSLNMKGIYLELLDMDEPTS